MYVVYWATIFGYGKDYYHVCSLMSDNIYYTFQFSICVT